MNRRGKKEAVTRAQSEQPSTPKEEEPATRLQNSTIPSTAKRRRNEPEQEPVKVFLRLRPLNEREIDAGETESIKITSGTTVATVAPVGSAAYRTGDSSEHRFSFDQIIDADTSQKDVFQTTTMPLLHSFLAKGQSALLYAYGRTGSGKTYSIMGPKSRPGIIPRALDVIFNSIHRREKGICTPSKRLAPLQEWSIIAMDDLEEYRHMVFVSFLDVYNEQLYDLLATSKGEERAPLQLKEDLHGSTFVRGLKTVLVKSAEEARELLYQGASNRRVGETMHNKDSSRSHAVFTIKLVKIPKSASKEQLAQNPGLLRHYTFSICDLAGSERSDSTTNVSSQIMQQAGNINKSMLVFGRCMESLRYNQSHPNVPQKIVPFRDSKLTRLFQEFMTGATGGKCVMLCCVSPSSSAYDETVNSLRFAASTKEVVTTTRVDTGRTKETQRSAKRRTFAPPTSPTDKKENDISKMQKKMLMQEIDEMRRMLQEAEDRAAYIEEEIRAEVSEEMAEKLEEMEKFYQDRLQHHLEIAEEKYKKKIELVNKINATREEDEQEEFKDRLISEKTPSEIEAICRALRVEHGQLCSKYDTVCAQYDLLSKEDKKKDTIIADLKIRLATSQMEKENILEKISVLENAVQDLHQDRTSQYMEELGDLRANFDEKSYFMEKDRDALIAQIKMLCSENQQLRKAVDSLVQIQNVNSSVVPIKSSSTISNSNSKPGLKSVGKAKSNKALNTNATTSTKPEDGAVMNPVNLVDLGEVVLDGEDEWEKIALDDGAKGKKRGRGKRKNATENILMSPLKTLRDLKRKVTANKIPDAVPQTTSAAMNEMQRQLAEDDHEVEEGSVEDLLMRSIELDNADEGSIPQQPPKADAFRKFTKRDALDHASDSEAELDENTENETNNKKRKTTQPNAVVKSSSTIVITKTTKTKTVNQAPNKTGKKGNKTLQNPLTPLKRRLRKDQNKK